MAEVIAGDPTDEASPTHSSTVDRYLETIYYIAAESGVVRPGQLSTWLGVRAPTVSESLHKLERDGWIEVAGDRSVALTARGEAVAQGVVRKHRVLERWLTDVLGFDWAQADVEAERMAHAISDDVVDRIDRSMGSPTTCPHGNAIPGRTVSYGDLTSLGELPVGAVARVRRISEVAEHESQTLLRLLATGGVSEGTVVEVTARRDGEVALRVSGGDVVVPMGAAGAIWVEAEAVAP